MSTVIMRTTARTVVPLMLVVAIALFLQGHNLPGGGFIGGVLTAAAFALLYVAYGAEYIEDDVLGRRENGNPQSAIEDYRLLFGAGLALALVSGLVPLLFGLPFMSQAVAILHDVPLYGEVELASALAFDLGVYCVVVGALLTVLSVVGAE
jgi:multicomponent Na+:H+ antiporter subunit B